jgi:hypothetical protein
MSYRQTSICEPNEDIKSKFKINVLSVEKHQLFGLFGCPQTEALNTGTLTIHTKPRTNSE